MTRRAVGVALAASAVAATGRPARGEPRVDLDRCAALDRAALDKAIAAELGGVDPARRASVDRVVIVECPDAVTAHLHLEPAPTGGPIARSLDLGEMATDLRPRLVALAVVELVEIAALVADSPPAPAPAPGPEAPPPPDAVEPTHLRDAPARTAAFVDPASTPPIGIGAVDRVRPADHRATRRALGDGGLLRGRAITPRAGVRAYPGHAPTMLDVGVEVVQGVISVGARGAFGTTDDPLGTIRPFLIAGAAGLTLACGRDGAIEACAIARLTAGIAGATASASDATIESATGTAPYLELGGQLEVAWRGERRAAVLAVDAGWAEGVVITAGSREAARLAGLAVVVSLGARL